jgi:hypothetical protein
MTSDFEIDGITLRVDKEATKTFYFTECRITDNCGCDDCAFYANIWIKQRFEIFQVLEQMGVDLGKNLSSEPTGVWCIRGDNGQLIYFDQVYRVFGTIVAKGRKEITYLRTEDKYKIEAKFIQYKSDWVDIELTFDTTADE